MLIHHQVIKYKFIKENVNSALTLCTAFAAESYLSYVQYIFTLHTITDTTKSILILSDPWYQDILIVFVFQVKLTIVYLSDGLNKFILIYMMVLEIISDLVYKPRDKWRCVVHGSRFPLSVSNYASKNVFQFLLVSAHDDIQTQLDIQT